MTPDVLNASLQVAPWLLVSALLTTACDGSSGNESFEFLGAPPAYASLCPGDDLGLTTDANNVAVEVCTAAQPCEYQCDSGYRYDNSHFTNPDPNDYSINPGSSCAAIPNIGLTTPSLFVD